MWKSDSNFGYFYSSKSSTPTPAGFGYAGCQVKTRPTRTVKSDIGVGTTSPKNLRMWSEHDRDTSWVDKTTQMIPPIRYRRYLDTIKESSTAHLLLVQNKYTPQPDRKYFTEKMSHSKKFMRPLISEHTHTDQSNQLGCHQAVSFSPVQKCRFRGR